MVHMKTILTIAIIFIIQVNGNEVVLQGQGRDGSFNEIRKHEESLPGGGSSVMITRRMFGAPIKSIVKSSSSSSLGVPNFLASLQSPFNVNNQLGLTTPSGFAPQQSESRWNSFAPWNQVQQPSSSSQWNFPSQSGGNANLAPLGLPNNLQWNLGSQFGFPNNENSQLGYNPLQSGSSQWLSPSSPNEFNPSSQSSLVSQWGSSSKFFNPLSGMGDTSGQPNLPSILGSNSNLNVHPQINDNYNPDPSVNYNSLMGAPFAPEAGLAAQQSLLPQFDTNRNSVPGLNLNSLQSNYGESNQQYPWSVSQPQGGLSNYFQGNPTVQGQQGIEQLLSQIPNQGSSIGSTWGGYNSQQLPVQGYQQMLNNPQTLSSGPSAWAKSEASSSLGKRSTDEAEEDNAEEHWLKK